MDVEALLICVWIFSSLFNNEFKFYLCLNSLTLSHTLITTSYKRFSFKLNTINPREFSSCKLSQEFFFLSFRGDEKICINSSARIIKCHCTINYANLFDSSKQCTRETINYFNAISFVSLIILYIFSNSTFSWVLMMLKKRKFTSELFLE